jgi:hypothetical protein
MNVPVATQHMGGQHILFNPPHGCEMTRKRSLKEPEQRATPRFRGALHVIAECGCKGMTRNLSSTGVFFETDGSLSPGQSIEFSIVLDHLYPDRSVCLKCKGMIARVEENGQKICVATTIDSHYIVDQHQY